MLDEDLDLLQCYKSLAGATLTIINLMLHENEKDIIRDDKISIAARTDLHLQRIAIWSKKLETTVMI